MIRLSAALIGFGAFCCTALAQSYTFTTFAGLPPQIGTADGGPNDARFNYPAAVAIDGSGNAFVADYSNHTLRKITPAGVVTTFAGTAGQSGSTDGTGAAARFNNPTGVTLDSAGNLYVSEFGNHTIRKITPAGVVSTLAGTAGSSGSADGTGSSVRFNGPGGLVADSSGNLYVCDRNNRVVRKITPTGTVTTFAGAAGVRGSTDGTGSNARFALPSNIAIDGAGNLYVTDSSNATIRKINPAGAVTTVAGSADLFGTTNAVGAAARFSTPQGIAVDSAGIVFVADGGNHNLRRIATDGTVTTFAGGTTRGYTNGTGGTARFYQPIGLAFDSNGALYVADSYNQAVRKVTNAAVVSTLAGGQSGFGFTDGNGSNARFHFPYGLVGDSKGNLFVCDYQYGIVRRITPGADVTTFAGSPGAFGSSDGTGTAARFSAPIGITADGADNLFVTDYLLDIVRKITPAGVVTTLAGSAAAASGSTDGVGSAARFFGPQGIAVDTAGNLYVADSLNSTIRKIAPDNTVTTLAGTPAPAGLGNANGTGAAARFLLPAAVAVDRSGNVYVADTFNFTIRKITPAGVVTTLAGTPGAAGSTDGNGSAARFAGPQGLTVDPNGNIFVSDGPTIRRISPTGGVSTIAGSSGVWTGHEGSGTKARFIQPQGIWLDPKGTLYIVDNGTNAIVKGVLDTIPDISAQPRAATLLLGSSATFSVTASGGGLSYQWKLNGTAIADATNATYTVANVSQAAAGNYTVDIINSAGVTTSAAAPLVVTLPGRLINLSVLTSVAVAPDNFTVGTVVGGGGTTGAKPLLIRAVGPSLATLGVAGALDNPKLEFYTGGTKTSENNAWAGEAQVAATMPQVGAFPLTGPTSKDAALFVADATGAGKSVKISSNGTGSGLVLMELYDATPTTSYGTTTPRLINVSVLKSTSGGLTAGFVIGGTTPLKVLVRAIGPTLTSFGVGGPLANPRLELFDSAQKSINANAGWGGGAELSAAFTAVGAFALDPASRDAALLLTLTPGNYTAQVSGVGNTNGVALVEVYEVP